MATYNLKRFSSPEALKTISSDLLLALLNQYSQYFSSRGLTLPAQPREDGLDYERLADILMNPEKDTPPGLADALYFIHEMATPERMDVLLPAAERRGIRIDGKTDPTPADVAIQVYLIDKDFLERQHAEQQVATRRSFEYFGANVFPVPEFTPPSAESLTALEADLDDWYEEKKRGRGSRVFVVSKTDAVWFLVRHGDPYTREGTFEGNEPFVFFRPEKYDVLVYNLSSGDIRMNACSRGEKDFFRKRFGLHVFGDENFFPTGKTFTLEPLRNGATSIACSDIAGMESVALKEIRFRWGGDQNEIEIRQANDVYAAFDARERDFPAKLPIIQAKFEIEFTESKAKRSLVLNPFRANYTRDSDSDVIQDWLAKRGFTLERQDDENRVE